MSFGAPEDSHQSLIGNILETTMQVRPRKFYIPKKGINLRESFSVMVPRVTEHTEENTIVLPGVYSHMTINEPEIIQQITTTITEKLESQ